MVKESTPDQNEPANDCAQENPEDEPEKKDMEEKTEIEEVKNSEEPVVLQDDESQDKQECIHEEGTYTDMLIDP